MVAPVYSGKGGFKQGPGVTGLGPVEDGSGVALFHDATALHHHDAVAEGFHHLEVVTDNGLILIREATGERLEKALKAHIADMFAA